MINTGFELGASISGSKDDHLVIRGSSCRMVHVSADLVQMYTNRVPKPSEIFVFVCNLEAESCEDFV